jgi:hypothetical protein
VEDTEPKPIDDSESAAKDIEVLLLMAVETVLVAVDAVLMAVEAVLTAAETELMAVETAFEDICARHLF